MSDPIVCWKCGEKLGKIPHPFPFREDCDKCGADLHCCINCKFYSPGMPNDCRVPGTEFVSDREKFNFCEEFGLKGTKKETKTSKEDVASRLFGEE